MKMSLIVATLLLQVTCFAKPVYNIDTMTTKTIVFIHGLFMNHESWKDWKIYFENKGYTCIVPTYPYRNATPEELRVNPPEKLTELDYQAVLNHYANIIAELDEKPILIGHSMGGLLVQSLVNKGLAAKGICIDSAPPKGITTFKWSFLKSNIATVNPLKGNSAFLPSVKWFQYAFCNTMTMKETEALYNQFVVPESRNIPRSSTKKQGKIDFKTPHVPLLFIAGEKDHIIPASLNKKNAKAYKDKNSVVDFKEFKDRTHILCAQENWEEIADYIHNWILKQEKKEPSIVGS